MAEVSAEVAALEKAGVEFIDGDESGVKLRSEGKRTRKRQRLPQPAIRRNQESEMMRSA